MSRSDQMPDIPELGARIALEVISQGNAEYCGLDREPTLPELLATVARRAALEGISLYVANVLADARYR